MTMLKYPYTGLGQFSLYLGRELLKNSPSEYSYDFLLYPSKENFFEEYAYNPQKIGFLMRKLAKKGLPYTFKKYDLWHITSQQSNYFPYHTKSPVIYTIHDLNFLKEEKEDIIQKKLKKIQKQINQTTVLTAISNYTAEDVKKNFDLGGKTIQIIHNGVEIAHYSQTTRPTYIPADKPFLFTIGMIVAKKNFQVLIPMMKYLPTLNLVIAGKDNDNYTEKLKQDAKEAGVEDRVLLVGEVSNEDKYWLYQNCQAFVFPSLLEGFGMPIIEALSLGKPVFSSTATSLPEVGGKVAKYWHNFEPEYMANTFMQSMQEINQDAHFAEVAKLHAATFTWKEAGRKYLDLYHRIW